MNSNIIIGIVLLILLVLLISITLLLSKKINNTVTFVLYVLCGLVLIGAIISFSIKSSNNVSSGGTGGGTGGTGGSGTYNLLSNFSVGKPSYMTSGHSWTITNISNVATNAPIITNGVVSSTGLGFAIQGSGTASIPTNTIWSKNMGSTPWGTGCLIDSLNPGQSCTINWNIPPNSTIEFYNLGANYLITIDANGNFSYISNPPSYIISSFTITAQ
jgi:hypothetical protein